MKKTYILICCAMQKEAEPLLDALGLKKIKSSLFPLYKGTYCGKEILLGISGIGSVLMASLVTYVMGHYQVSHILNYGVAGGYGNSMHTGDILLVSSCLPTNPFQTDIRFSGDGISLEGTHYCSFHEGLDNQRLYLNGDSQLIQAFTQLYPQAVCGAIASGDSWNREYDKIAYLHNTYHVLGEDMECVSVYQLGHFFQIPCFSIKVISNNEMLQESYDFSVIAAAVSVIIHYLEVC